jgi:DNA-binding IclR family transcriptional regulator
MPLHCTAIGKVLLAYADADQQREVLLGPLERRTPRTVVAPGVLQRQLEAVLETGVAFEREESTLGLLCVAAPVLDATGTETVAAISITGPVGRFRPESHIDALRAAATGLGSLIARRRLRA